uniref:Uncharacterized protein n=2 Tax=Oryza meridionalis TaxID=40149 RepID=A0A0E0CSS5_9ORYZ
MAPSILHRASSFSNPAVHHRHLSTFQEGSGVSNRYEGLALLTTIVEGGGNCNPASDPLPNQPMLSTSLINKILHLIDALDLPCRRSYIALDQFHGQIDLHLPFQINSVAFGYPGSTKDRIPKIWGSMYRHLRDRVEGGASHPHGGKSSRDKKARGSPAAGVNGGGAGHGMADASAEMTKRRAKMRKTRWLHKLRRGIIHQQTAGVSRMLWRVFQLAFRVYNFAGGQDERADRLTTTLAREIEAHASSVTLRSVFMVHDEVAESDTVNPIMCNCGPSVDGYTAQIKS